MNWFKENPFLAGIAAVCLIGATAFGYLIFQSVVAYSESSDAYTAAVSKLHTLQNKVPFPSADNLKTIQAGLDDHAARINALRTQLAKMEFPLDQKVTPQQFQDELRTAVNELRNKAENNGVKLPANFYFGFDQYQSQVPTEQAAPYLNRQFRVIQSLISRLVDFKVASIDGVVRPPLVQEKPGSAATQKTAEATAPVLTRYPFDIGFTAEQGRFRVAFNSLLGSDQFLIARSVGIENTAPQAPTKKSAEQPPPPNPFASAGSSSKDQNSLQVILGRELLKITLRLEMLDFSEPDAPPKK